MDEHFVVSYFRTNVPINLRNIVVHPTLIHPIHNVGIKIIVVLRTPCGTTLTTVLPRRTVTIYAKRRYTKFHPRLDRTHQPMQVTNEQIHIVTPPILNVGKAARVSIIVWLIGQRKSVDGIRIEIVVHVDAIHIVVVQNVFHHHASIKTVLLQGWIENIQSVILKHTLRMAHGWMILSQCSGIFCLGTIGINPCVTLHLAFMALLHHPSQRIPPVSRSHALHTCQIARPRLITGFVERITLSPHLKEDGVDATLLQRVELRGEHLPYLRH